MFLQIDDQPDGRRIVTGCNSACPAVGDLPNGRAFVPAPAGVEILFGLTTYDGGTFTTPPPPPVTKTISKLAFLKILTPSELAAVYGGAATDATLAYAKSLLDASMTMTATEPIFQQMLAYCVSKGIFSQARAAAIVAAMQA